MKSTNNFKNYERGGDHKGLKIIKNIPLIKNNGEKEVWLDDVGAWFYDLGDGRWSMKIGGLAIVAVGSSIFQELIRQGGAWSWL